MTFPCASLLGLHWSVRDFVYISRRSGPTSIASSSSTLELRLSGPGDLVGFRSFSSLTIPLRVIS